VNDELQVLPMPCTTSLYATLNIYFPLVPNSRFSFRH